MHGTIRCGDVPALGLASSEDTMELPLPIVGEFRAHISLRKPWSDLTSHSMFHCLTLRHRYVLIAGSSQTVSGRGWTRELGSIVCMVCVSHCCWRGHGGMGQRTTVVGKLLRSHKLYR